jgi:glycolate oxidase
MLNPALLAAFGTILPAASILTAAEDTRPYECDGLTLFRELPGAVLLPENEAQVVSILKLCHAAHLPVVARGAGTGLSGGALPDRDGVILSLAKFKRILALDVLGRTATVEPGVRNLAISEAAAAHGLFYAPDPSSQIACTIGGNVAENSGGVHCLKYGLTLHNVRRVRGVLITGEVVEFGSEALDAPSDPRDCSRSSPKSRSNSRRRRATPDASWRRSTRWRTPARRWPRSSAPALFRRGSK